MLAKILMALGVVLVAAGVVILATGGDDTPTSSPTSTTSTPPSSTTSSSTTTSTTTTSTTTTTTTSTVPVAAESPAEFFAVFQGAFDRADSDVLIERLNPAVVDRYGASQCQAYVESVAGEGLEGTLLSTSEVDSWDYTTDDLTTTVAGVIAAELERTINGQTLPQTTHWQAVDGRYTWFTDCGSPA